MSPATPDSPSKTVRPSASSAAEWGCARLGVPLGSGAIESSIRRVVNLRLKGNSIYWREENAEAMLQIRAQVLTNRWDERLAVLRQLQSYDIDSGVWTRSRMTHGP